MLKSFCVGGVLALMSAGAFAQQKFTPEQVQQGSEIFAANCAVCHQPNGKGGGPFPALDGSKIANGPLAGHVDIVLHGKAAMPPWAQSLAPSRSARLEITTTLRESARWSATERPARPLPTIATSKFIMVGRTIDDLTRGRCSRAFFAGKRSRS